MNITKTYKTLFGGCLACTLSLTSCIEEVMPIDTMLPGHVEGMTQSQEALLNGIVAFVNDYNTWGGSEYYYNDWGYPCQMTFREVQGSDFPIYGGDYNYWGSVESSVSLTSTAYYTYYYYYRFILNCNTLLGVIGNPETAPVASRQYYGCALAFRAMCYLDLARIYEYQPTGIAELDQMASEIKLPLEVDPEQKAGVWGLTVPIVTDKTPEAQLTCNPRAPYYTMYRFINSDLENAETYLAGYTRPDGTYPNRSVVYGLKARFWLELATRFSRSADDLKEQVAHEGDNDGYKDLGINSAADCYAKAAEYARKAQEGFTPMTEAEWLNKQEGFNTATDSWIFYTSISTQEQQGNYYSSLMGIVCTEATWAMPQYGGGNYRCIGDWLYNRIPESDWRRKAWISEEDATAAAEAIKMDENTRKETFNELRKKYNYNVSDSLFSCFPPYANMKFRARDINKMIEGMKCDIPLMRVEEMIFIESEAEARLKGAAAGSAVLNRFMQRYRYSDYNYQANTADDLTNELMIQRRIELWGEGLNFFDYKRLRLQVRRTDNGNYTDNHQHDSNDGYVCPTMNYFIPTYETNNNTAVKRNPDPSKWYNKK